MHVHVPWPCSMGVHREPVSSYVQGQIRIDMLTFFRSRLG